MRRQILKLTLFSKSGKTLGLKEIVCYINHVFRVSQHLLFVGQVSPLLQTTKALRESTGIALLCF
jgi:hypothetical protein